MINDLPGGSSSASAKNSSLPVYSVTSSAFSTARELPTFLSAPTLIQVSSRLTRVLMIMVVMMLLVLLLGQRAAHIPFGTHPHTGDESMSVHDALDYQADVVVDVDVDDGPDD